MWWKYVHKFSDSDIETTKGPNLLNIILPVNNKTTDRKRSIIGKKSQQQHFHERIIIAHESIQCKVLNGNHF